MHAPSVIEPSGRASPDFRPWRLRANDRLEARRRELFALAAPVFRRDGYRGATIKALAHACGLSPASLYHYFASKEELATYLVRRPRMDWDSTWVDPDERPARATGAAARPVAGRAPELPARAATGRRDRRHRLGRGLHARTFREGEAVFARLVAASAPGMSRAEATRVARDALSAMVGSAVLGLDPIPKRRSASAWSRSCGRRSCPRTSSRSGSTRRCSEPNRPPDRFGRRRP